ncbi:hypothetical protein [Actinomadura violacea]|uniref:Uncharacterized protein n=1 Tax=Actinomadura violacea TaxID=2819934 RepID=A0ABS3RSU5_9ACTN|nr:hypothetical protein [Actinomadura violacea]MBO2459368.1 hypothetical protein [Actinomadura violacea]
MSGFANAIIGGAEALIRKAMRSPNYVPASEGWTVNKDGSAEFNDVAVRGSVDVGTATQYTKIYNAPAPIDGPAIVFNSDSTTYPDDGYIRALSAGPGTAYAALEISTPAGVGQDPAQLFLVSGDSSPGVAPSAGFFGDVDINGGLTVDPTAGNNVLTADDTGVVTNVTLTANAGISLPAGEYAKRGALFPVPAASFQNGWTNFGNNYQPAAFVEYADGTAGLSGVVSGGTTTNGTVIFALPSNLWPAFNHVWCSPGTGGKHSQISVHSDGHVVIQVPDTGTTWVSLDPCRWPIAGF